MHARYRFHIDPFYPLEQLVLCPFNWEGGGGVFWSSICALLSHTFTYYMYLVVVCALCSNVSKILNTTAIDPNRILNYLGMVFFPRQCLLNNTLKKTEFSNEICPYSIYETCNLV